MNEGAIASGFEGLMRAMIAEHRPTLLAWERPFLDMKRVAQGELRTQRLYGEAWTLIKLSHEYKLTTWFGRPASIRKRVIGKGNASEDEIMAFCHRNGLKPANPHEADSYLIWVAAGGGRGRAAAGHEGERRRA